MTNLILPPSTIGIIGGGQLGRMMAISAKQMGYKVAVLEPAALGPLAQVADLEINAPYDSEEALTQLLAVSDVVTYEFENIDSHVVEKLASAGYIPQGYRPLAMTQHRYIEKTSINNCGFKTAPFEKVDNFNDLKNAIKKIGYPSILKTVSGGYDGKGQYLIEKKEDLQLNEQAIKAILTEQNLIFEAICRFEYEASVIVARDILGNIQVFPPSINQHIHGVLFSSSVGEELSPEVEQEMTKIATKIAEAGNLVGVCGVEFFVTKGQQVLVNEIAPRPHNSGHYTIEACNISQFDQHILAITGRPLVPIKLNDSALMINILGQHMGQLEETIQQYPEAMLHFYGKDEAKDQRKMGHFTVLVEDAHALLESQFLQSWRQTF